jgi:hypothetical protein
MSGVYRRNCDSTDIGVYTEINSIRLKTRICRPTSALPHVGLLAEICVFRARMSINRVYKLSPRGAGHKNAAQPTFLPRASRQKLSDANVIGATLASP